MTENNVAIEKEPVKSVVIDRENILSDGETGLGKIREALFGSDRPKDEELIPAMQAVEKAIREFGYMHNEDLARRGLSNGNEAK